MGNVFHEISQKQKEDHGAWCLKEALAHHRVAGYSFYTRSRVFLAGVHGGMPVERIENWFAFSRKHLFVRVEQWLVAYFGSLKPQSGDVLSPWSFEYIYDANVDAALYGYNHQKIQGGLEIIAEASTLETSDIDLRLVVFRKGLATLLHDLLELRLEERTRYLHQLQNNLVLRDALSHLSWLLHPKHKDLLTWRPLFVASIMLAMEIANIESPVWIKEIHVLQLHSLETKTPVVIF